MALPSLFKRGCDEACGWGWVGEPFLSFPDLVLVPPAPSTSSTRRPDAPLPASLPLEPDVNLMNFDQDHCSSSQ